MKVLTVTHVFPRHGEDTVAPFLRNFHQALIRNGAEVVVSAPHHAGLAMEEQAEDGYRISRFRYSSDRLERIAYQGQMHELVIKNHFNKLLFIQFLATQFVHIAKMIKQEKPDLIHVHWWIPSGLTVLIAAKLFKIPYVITTHGTDVFILQRFKFLRPFAKMVFGNASRVHVISTYVQSLLQDFLPSKTAYDTVPMPVREEIFPLIQPHHSRGHTILGIGRLVERKGFAVLIRALALLPEPYRVTLIGTGPEKENLVALATECSVEQRITWIDSVPPKGLSEQFQNADIFVLPSLTDWKGEKEGLGMVLLEATRSGVPLICSNSGGMTDIVTDCKTGRLFPENDHAALAEMIQSLENQEFCVQMVKNAQDRYRSTFAQEMIGKRAVESYTKAIQ